MNYMATFHPLLHMIDTLHTGVYLKNIRWNRKIICSHCNSISEHHYKQTKDGMFEDLYE